MLFSTAMERLRIWVVRLIEVQCRRRFMHSYQLQAIWPNCGDMLASVILDHIGLPDTVQTA